MVKDINQGARLGGDSGDHRTFEVKIDLSC